MSLSPVFTEPGPFIMFFDTKFGISVAHKLERFMAIKKVVTTCVKISMYLTHPLAPKQERTLWTFIY